MEECVITKEAWIAEGQSLSQNYSADSFKLGRWLLAGEAFYIGERPSTKKKLRGWREWVRDQKKVLIREAAQITNLKEGTVRQIYRVMKHGAIVEGLSFTHHTEVQRAHYFNEKGKRRFDYNAALNILNDAKQNNWTVQQVRAEMEQKYPTPENVKSVVEIARQQLAKILGSLSNIDDYDMVIDALLSALQAAKDDHSRFQPRVSKNQPMFDFDDEDEFEFDRENFY